MENTIFHIAYFLPLELSFQLICLLLIALLHIKMLGLGGVVLTDRQTDIHTDT